MEILKYLNEENLDDFLKNFDFETLDAGDEEGNTFLHKLVKMGNVYGVDVLADIGADINARNKKGETPAHIAAEIDNIEIFQILSDYGADFNIRNNSQRTPERIARMNNGVEILKIISNYSEDYGSIEKMKCHRELED
ncbi:MULTISPECIES: ankyrin repeat domain-containing protein [Psychrilyobacter]|uniref:Ankyrin repeat domain-containing protein n=1 Tax=Psychrilyobacter piezotolerans TaxID=2293438 RepID=A0ABX9KIT8_9FUSO|nr:MULTISPECIES: ankyrin repeat domain-containing protein [Psychrilyobacter]MCS5420627.1 ankyrin repeat domain-containing protein [Psychrilyobacter sp. S5]NDI77354.1 ankyrin repeat domain-containing protein [Psychrilyobacter piezotolerans]RDE63661.1 ankyrin repeat domain-containing protein [Psychrilyobacter sp. S5]REI42005.1 ankyrin repeat domain-containing protein [Psychrilyobacter piezotolerans]